jgi:hypothetical protein
MAIMEIENFSSPFTDFLWGKKWILRWEMFLGYIGLLTDYLHVPFNVQIIVPKMPTIRCFTPSAIWDAVRLYFTVVLLLKFQPVIIYN